MSRIFKPDLLSLCKLLNKSRVEYLLIGAQAGILYGLPRATLDVDIFIKKDLKNCNKLVSALRKIGFGIAKEVEPEDIYNKAVFIFADQIRIDIFTKPWGVESFEKASGRKVIFDIEGVKIPVASLDDLIKSKDTDRAQDKSDMEVLKKIKEQK